MNVFLAGIIQGSLVEADIHDQDWREPIQRALAAHVPDADVYCHYSRHPDSITYGIEDIRRTFAEGNRLAGECDLLIAYVPSASMGTAVEMHEAVRGGAVVLTVTPLAANWVIRAYSDEVFPDVNALERYLASGALDEAIRRKREQTT